MKERGYFTLMKRNIYEVEHELFYVDPTWNLHVDPPTRPREPRLDLLLIVLSGDHTPRAAFVRLWGGAVGDPGAVYQRARRELPRYGYIEDDGHWRYYPGPRAEWLRKLGRGEAAIPPSPLQNI
ncbi:hypothetical protein NAS2_1084 [Conexivisphaera calida]|uniref:Uncharacterized protein n=1 Tax=Conexivisphaera calida TaxID=1874277 RepID=A0A4P2VG78_9ARCH|nr:hypothetical protein NAS2_1084 [Conexivisphaera calida]